METYFLNLKEAAEEEQSSLVQQLTGIIPGSEDVGQAYGDYLVEKYGMPF